MIMPNIDDILLNGKAEDHPNLLRVDDNGVYLKFDSIVIEPLNQVNGSLVINVHLFNDGVRVNHSSFPVSHGDGLKLTGVSGDIKIVLS